MAKIRVNPMHADRIVWPTPQTIANIGDISKLDARCTNAMAAELTTPLVAGDTTPMTKIRMEKNRPNLCFRNVTNAIRAAHVWMNIDENNAHRKMWYHISGNIRNDPSRKPITSAKVSSSVTCSVPNIFPKWTMRFRYNSDKIYNKNYLPFFFLYYIMFVAERAAYSEDKCNCDHMMVILGNWCLVVWLINYYFCAGCCW